MNARVIAISVFFVFSGVSVTGAPIQSQSPCGGEYCALSGDEKLKRLNSAYLSSETTDIERERMRSVIAAKTSNGRTDWTAAAKEYFDWRANAHGYKPPSPETDGKADPPALVAERQRQEALNRERKFRTTAEAAVRARLIDPDSAKFQWPHGFMLGYWKPFLSKRVEGYWTCGLVNARNRMGGYTGSSAFVTVLDENGTPEYVEIGEDRQFDVTTAGCAKAARILPPPPPGVEENQTSVSEGVSVAGELEKLASLRDRGIITQSEFEAQKAKLLGEH